MKFSHSLSPSATTLGVLTTRRPAAARQPVRRETWRHPCTMAKKIKTDHELAAPISGTPATSKRINSLATLIIKPKSLSALELDKRLDPAPAAGMPTVMPGGECACPTGPPTTTGSEASGFLTRPRERESSGSGDAGAEMTGADSTSPRRTLRRLDQAEACNEYLSASRKFPTTSPNIVSRRERPFGSGVECRTTIPTAGH